MMAFAINFTENFKLGLNFKMSRSNVDDSYFRDINDTGIGIDDWIFYIKVLSNFKVGFRLKNLIGKNRWKYFDIRKEITQYMYFQKYFHWVLSICITECCTSVGPCDISLVPIRP